MTGGGGRPGPRGSRTVALATRLYAAAAAVLPRDLRAQYGDELIACFRGIAENARRRRGRVAVLVVTVRCMVDLARRAPKEHLAAARAGVLETRGGWGGTWLDVRHALRRLRRRPGFTGAAVLTLAVGIAAATAVFSLVYGVVLSPLPYPDANRIVVIDHGGSGIDIDRGLGVTYGFYRFYAARAREVESMAMYTTYDETLTGAGEPLRVPIALTTPTLADVLRVRPALGRWFVAGDAEDGAADVAILSHALWRDRFGSDPGILGGTIDLAGTPHVVVGVMPADFAFPDDDVALWLPLEVPETGIGGWNRLAVARLAPGATPESFERELASLLPFLRANNDDPERVTMYLDEAKVAPRIVTLKESLVGDVRATLWILLGTVGFVLLIAVGNVANLFLVRAEEGQREAAVRSALGADRGQVARGFMVETLLVALVAGAAGIAIAGAGVGVLRTRAPVEIPRLADVGMDPVVVGVAVGIALVAALLLGLIPALRQPKDLPATLKDASGRSTSGRRRLRGRNALVATQVALALVLLIGSGLLFRTFQQLRAVDLGFTTRRALTFEIGLPGTRYEDRQAAQAFHDRLLAKLDALPGVEAAAVVAQCLPLSGGMCWGDVLEAEGHPTPEGTVPPVTGSRLASSAYFRALGIPVRGRTFDDGDVVDEPDVAILSQAAVDAYFAGDDPIGRRVRILGGPWYTVIGVAGDVRAKVATDEFQRVIYLPFTPDGELGPTPWRVTYVLRTAVAPSSLVPAVRRTVADVDPLVPLASVQPLQDIIDRATAPAVFALTLIGLAALTALLLGAIGVYAVLAYAVSRRSGEIGVRMALGARAGDVRALVLRQGALVVLAGVAAGLAGALALTRLMRGMLHGVSATDPLSYASVTALLLVVSAIALYLPARRASRVDPIEALRRG